MKMPVSRVLIISAAVSAVLAPAESIAQDTARERVLEEVVVTSRKREESLLETPLAITAFSANKIQNMGLEEITDLVDFSPGFFYSEHSVGRGGRFNRRLIFRGMNPRTDRQTRQSATVFIDGAPILGSEIGATENYERIEVIKGPQSAYFGRQTFSGAINAVTRVPGDEWSGQISAQAGRFGTRLLKGQVEGPIIEDKLTFRVNGSTYETDGEWKNTANPGERLGAETTDDIALSLFASPTENFTAKLRLHAWKNDDGPSVGIGISRPQYPELFTCTPGGVASGNGSWACGELPYFGQSAVGMDTVLTPELRQAYYNSEIRAAYVADVPNGFGLVRDAAEASLNLDYVFTNGWTLTSITAAHTNDYSSFEDFDRQPSAGETGTLFGAPSSSDSYNMSVNAIEDFSQELRLSSASDQRLRWSVGLSYSEIEVYLQSFTQLAGNPPNPNSTTSTFEPETTAIFGSIGWDITERLTLSVEGRVQDDKVVEGVVGQGNLSETFRSVNPRVILDYEPLDGTTVYFTYAEGTNPGQFNAGLLGRTQDELDQIAAAGASGIEVDEEELTNYEFGIKSRFWDGRAQASAAIYFSDWSNIVAPELVPIINANGDPENVQVNSNGGQADLSGLELEGSVLLTDNLTVDFTFALNRSEINDFESPDALALLGDRTIDGFGNSFSRYPEESGSLSLTYENTFAGGWGWYTRGDVIYRGSTWMTNANLTETGDITTVNLRLGFENEHWRVEAYGTNIFDEEGYSNFQQFPDFTGQSGVGTSARMILAGYIPRMNYGLRAFYNF